MTFQQAPYLRNQRQFPNENLKDLSKEVDLAYIDIASKVNERSIGIYAVNYSMVTGDQWYLTGSNQKQQTLRRLYTFTAAGNIAHGLTLTQLSAITKIYGTFTDGTNWLPLPYVDVISVTNQVNVYVSPTNIVITAGAGTPPTITSGYVVLEWLSQV